MKTNLIPVWLTASYRQRLFKAEPAALVSLWEVLNSYSNVFCHIWGRIPFLCFNLKIIGQLILLIHSKQVALSLIPNTSWQTEPSCRVMLQTRERKRASATLRWKVEQQRSVVGRESHWSCEETKARPPSLIREQTCLPLGIRRLLTAHLRRDCI